MKKALLVAVASAVVVIGVVGAGLGPAGAQGPAGSGAGVASKPTTPPDPRPGPAVQSPQFGVPNQTDLFSVAANGAVQVQWVVGAGQWNGPLAISSPGLVPQGAHLAASNQFGIPNQTDVFVVDSSGTVRVLWVEGAGRWGGPMAISTPGLAPTSFAGNGLAASRQFGITNQTDAFLVDTSGTVDVLWVDGAGAWNGPLGISPSMLASGGSGLAASNQFGVANQTDVFLVDNNDRVDVLWVDGSGPWGGPLGISPTNFAPSGIFLAASNQFGVPNQTDVFVVASDAAVKVVWVNGGGAWKGPLSISNSGLSIAGLGLTASNQLGLPSQTDVFVLNSSGATDVFWVEGAGAWKGPLQL